MKVSGKIFLFLTFTSLSLISSAEEMNTKFTSYSAYSVCEHLPLVERIGYKMEFASADNSHVRLHYSPTELSELSVEEANCLEKQNQEIDHAVQELKQNKKFKKAKTKFELHFHVVREDYSSTIKKILVDKSVEHPGIKPCKDELNCIDGSYWTETQRCRLTRAYDIIERY
jgi:hypothetical protein